MVNSVPDPMLPVLITALTICPHLSTVFSNLISTPILSVLHTLTKNTFVFYFFFNFTSERPKIEP